MRRRSVKLRLPIIRSHPRIRDDDGEEGDRLALEETAQQRRLQCRGERFG